MGTEIGTGDDSKFCACVGDDEKYGEEHGSVQSLLGTHKEVWVFVAPDLACRGCFPDVS